jgi:hypothetical protein
MGRDTVVWAIGFVWLVAIASGLWAWERYDSTPGTVQPQADATAETGCGRWQLAVFVHPHCPCARATLDQVAELVRLAPGVAVRVVFVRPPGTPDDWERGQLWNSAEAIPGAKLCCDVGGAEARRFGAETSGHAVLIDPNGRVVFRGGLTRARGRQGESPGHRAVLDWVNGNAGAAEAPVFGCPLFDQND